MNRLYFIVFLILFVSFKSYSSDEFSDKKKNPYNIFLIANFHVTQNCLTKEKNKKDIYR